MQQHPTSLKKYYLVDIARFHTTLHFEPKKVRIVTTADSGLACSSPLDMLLLEQWVVL
jgi:hypothetical protein